MFLKALASILLLRMTMGLFSLIEHCEDLESLNFFVLSEVWKEGSNIRNAILIRYDQLDPDRRNKDKFGTTEFWEADPLQPQEVMDEWEHDDDDDDDVVPDGYEVVDEWKEGKRTVSRGFKS